MGIYSFHPQGANTVFVDGSVHFIPQTVDLFVLFDLVARADGDVLTGSLWIRIKMVNSRLSAFCLLVLATLPWAGCGGSGARQYKVQGKVLSHGEPAAGAIVVLHP